MSLRRVRARDLLALAALATCAHAADVSVRKVEAIEGDATVVAIHLSAPLGEAPRVHLLAKTRTQPDRLTIDLPGTDLHGKPGRSANVGWGGVRRMRLGVPSPDTARVVLDLERPVTYEVASDGDVVRVTLAPMPPTKPAQSRGADTQK